MTPLDLLDSTPVSFDVFAQKPVGITTSRYKPAGKITAAFHNSRARIRFLRGPVGCGKTFAAFREIYTRAANMPVGKDGVARTRAIVIRRTYKQLKQSTVKSFWASLPERWREQGNFNKSDMTFELETTIRRGDAEITMSLEVIFLAMDRDRAIEDLKGAEFNVLYINEAMYVNAMALSMGLSRLGRWPEPVLFDDPSVREFYVLLDSNSFDPAHPFYDFFYNPDTIAANAKLAEMAAGDYVEVFDYPSGMSPDAENLENLEDNFYSKQCAGQTQQYIDVMVHNKFGSVAEGRPCYSGFLADIHARDYIAPDKNLPIFIGMDFGRDPAIVVCQESEDGCVSVIDADYRLQSEGATSIKEMFTRCAQKYSPNDGWTWVEGGHDSGHSGMTQVYDISPVQFALHTANQLGVCRTGAAIVNRPYDRIELVNRYLADIGTAGVPKLRISLDPTNKGLLWLIRSMSKYQYRVLKGTTGAVDTFSEQPEKDDHSHIAEALAYALLRPKGGAREQLKYHPKRRVPGEGKMATLNLSPFGR